MTIMRKIKRYFDVDDDYEDYESSDDSKGYEAQPDEKMKGGHTEKDKVVQFNTYRHPASKVIIIEPHSYDEVQQIADKLKEKVSVIINLQRIPWGEAKRIVDFLSGTVYAVNGDIQKLGDHIFLCTPENVEVAGSISEMLRE
ncbi:cell division protein SepF [Alkalicoccus halolimnae]|uniref:Cell division protein SepF n=1 Tax=Alkalicoccus halolimnae TaxID=1667239 RepID=A0A5C7FDI0_9BACI|nr:cell division protein SepF [Alkalicoccus halolimnae]TXF87530.1 cell division protein SepF [Alkalicoccus halolimnae]